ncbi:MAG: glucose-6-phosphate dehydrogenase [Phycisphaerae bacterium]
MASGKGSFRVNAYQEDTSAPAGAVVVFGATGDLNARKITPALYNLRKEGRISENTVVVGVARRPRSDQQYRQEMLQALCNHSRTQPIDTEMWNQWQENWYYHVTHADDQDEYDSLASRLDELQDKHGCGPNRLFYLAMTPDLFPKIAGHLGQAGLNKPGDDGFVRLVVEKPFGHDLKSACELNEAIHEHYDESQICRIDHYLGKETVQNLLVFRFANSIFEPIMNCHYINNVQITTAEKVGMEGRRGPYYEGVGAMRDMMQNHMLQVLSLLAMEPPVSMDAESIRDEKVKLLKALRPIRRDEWADHVVRGQYVASDQAQGPGYLEEQGVAEDSQVETFAAFKCFIDNWRWASVPFYLRTGKKLAAKVSEVVIEFKREPINLFQQLGCDMGGANHLHVRIAPHEGVSLTFDAKVPGTRMLLRPVSMNMDYNTAFESATPEGYEHLLLDALQGEMALFIRSDEVEAAWRFVDGIRRGFDDEKGPELRTYPAGSWGPDAADKLFEDPYKRWHPLDG